MVHEANLYKYADTQDQLNTESVSIVYYCKSAGNGTIQPLPINKLEEPVTLFFSPRFTQNDLNAIKESSNKLQMTPRLHERRIMDIHKFHLRGNNLALLIKVNKTNSSSRLMLYIGNDAWPWPSNFFMKMEFTADRSNVLITNCYFFYLAMITRKI